MAKKGESRRPTWDEYFMATAILMSTRSTCVNVRAGSVIVDQESKRIIGTGYNGAAPGMASCLERGCRKEAKGLDYEASLNTGNCEGIHSEMNALAHLTRLTHKPATLYATVYPCMGCAKNILGYGKINKIFYGTKYSKREQSTKDLLEKAGVQVTQLEISPERLMGMFFNLPPVKNFEAFSEEEKERVMQPFLTKSE